MTYSIDIKNIVISNLIDKIKKIIISKTLKISISTINAWEYLYRENIKPPFFSTGVLYSLFYNK